MLGQTKNQGMSRLDSIVLHGNICMFTKTPKPMVIPHKPENRKSKTPSFKFVANLNFHLFTVNRTALPPLP
jgi:hypothetical protein